MRVLHVTGSPRGSASVSTRLAAAFLAALSEQSEVEVDLLDPWTSDLPEVDGDLLAAKYGGITGTSLTPAQDAAWAAIRTLAARFQRADLLLFSVPLWNYGIPYKLKHLIDAISHKDILFSFDERGLNGLLGGRPAVAIYARGLGYGPESPTPDARFGLEKTYLETWFSFVGLTQTHSLIAEQVLGPHGDDIVARAEIEAARLAATLSAGAKEAIVMGPAP